MLHYEYPPVSCRRCSAPFMRTRRLAAVPSLPGYDGYNSSSAKPLAARVICKVLLAGRYRPKTALPWGNGGGGRRRVKGRERVVMSVR